MISSIAKAITSVSFGVAACAMPAPSAQALTAMVIATRADLINGFILLAPCFKRSWRLLEDAAPWTERSRLSWVCHAGKRAKTLGEAANPVLMGRMIGQQPVAVGQLEIRKVETRRDRATDQGKSATFGHRGAEPGAGRDHMLIGETI